jgi:phenylacetate-CoA ligase
LDPFNLNASAMREFLAALERRRPTLLQCFASAAYEFAGFLEEEGLGPNARALRLRGIVCSVEQLHPFQRAVIERVFGCRVFDLYGAREVHAVAAECQAHCGLHVGADNVVVEILDEHGCAVAAGDVGRVVVTDLWNPEFSLIRIDLGDLASFVPEGDDPCPCGVTFPRLMAVQGRSVDTFPLPNGSRVHGVRLLNLLGELPGARRFRLVQEEATELTLEVVGDPTIAGPHIAAALTDFPRRFNVKVKYRDEIPRTEAGKRRYVVSRVGRSGDLHHVSVPHT